MTLREYAGRQVSRLTGRVADQAEKLATSVHPEGIHDLRVAVRRLTQTLRLFARVLGRKKCRAMRRELKALMDLAGEVRTRDIALELFESTGIGRESAPCVRLALERDDAIRMLVSAAAGWRGSQSPP